MSAGCIAVVSLPRSGAPSPVLLAERRYALLQERVVLLDEARQDAALPPAERARAQAQYLTALQERQEAATLLLAADAPSAQEVTP